MSGYTKTTFEALVETIAVETTAFEDIYREELPDETDLTLAEYMIESLNEFGDPPEGWMKTVGSWVGVERLPYATVVALVLDFAALELLVRRQNRDSLGAGRQGSFSGLFSALAREDRFRAIRLLGDEGSLAWVHDRVHAQFPQLGAVRLVARGVNALAQLTEKIDSFRLDSANPAIYGPTDINAQSGNGSLSVALNSAGTMTVFRWPRPSFYDHLKYVTRGERDDGRPIVAPNEGAFLGLRVALDGDSETTWLREWETSQRYLDERSDAVETTYRNADYGLCVTVTDAVAREDDAFVRHVCVLRRLDSPVTGASLLAFENFNTVVSKHPQFPIRDWCEEERNTDLARYDPGNDAIVHTKAGIDTSTGQKRRVAIRMGFGTESAAHHVGGDAYESTAAPDGREGATRDAYDAAIDGSFPENDRYAGQTTGVLSCALDFEDDAEASDGTQTGAARATETTSATETATARVIFAASEDPADAGRVLDRTRERAFDTIRERKRAWFSEVLADAPMPDTDDPDVLALCERALVTLVENYDPESGAIVASIATQSPYAEDWPRDGAYFNYALDLVGLHDWVSAHNRWYASVQQHKGDPRPSMPVTPPGNWAMSYYADGVAGGPIPHEIDETGFGIWTLWEHYAVTRDREYLEDVYGAIERAADSLCDQRDPETGLQTPAFEDDRFETTQTTRGAGPVWLGLGAAAKAARVLGEDASAKRYAARREELGRAIEDVLFDHETGAYGTKRTEFPGSTLVWPVGFEPADASRLETHLDAVWEHVEPTFAEPEAGETRYGSYDSKNLLALATAHRREPPGSIQQVREGLRWVATHHATPDTHVLGESWVSRDGEIESIVSQPHAWEQVLFYLASLEAYPPETLEANPESDSRAGVLEALRAQNSPRRTRHTSE